LDKKERYQAVVGVTDYSSDEDTNRDHGKKNASRKVRDAPMDTSEIMDARNPRVAADLQEHLQMSEIKKRNFSTKIDELEQQKLEIEQRMA